jgi:DNA recombination protein RmuC
MVPTALLIISIFIAGMLAYLLYRTIRDSAGRADLLAENARLEADLRNERQNSEERIRFLEDSEKRLRIEFENIANRLFEEKSRIFTEKNREGITGLLQPFREQIESFRSKVEKGEKDRIAENARLIEVIRQLNELSNRVSEDASTLAKAIKGDVKTQGDWGELIVERIFEASGLQQGIEYEKQPGIRDDDGRLYRPDFIIHLPGKKDVIVDSKVSLTAFERFMNCDDDASGEAFLKEHISSVRRHVEELQAKDYGNLLGNRTLDFVIMCVPLEPAYQAALRDDPGIIYDLAGKSVVISGPTTLMITLKLIAQIWRREKENRNAEEIAERAGRLYDKVALVSEAMLESQKRLKGVSESFDTALGRLSRGQGNLIWQVEEIRRLGAKVSKRLPEPVLDQSEPEEQSGE